MKTASQQFDEEVKELKKDLNKTFLNLIREMFEVLEKTPPTPETAQYSTGDFSRSHELYINGIKQPKILPANMHLEPGDKLSFRSPLSYADHVLTTGWYGKRMADVWPGASHPAYRTYDRAADEMRGLRMNRIFAKFNTKKIRTSKKAKYSLDPGMM